jgi:hypothetical protein
MPLRKSTGQARRQPSRTSTVCEGPLSGHGGAMGDWLVRQFTIFNIPIQNCMVIALAIILIGIVLVAAPVGRPIGPFG